MKSRRCLETSIAGITERRPRRGNANRLTSVTDWNSNSTAYSYDDAGRMTTATLPSGTGIVSTYSYDNADRLTGISHVKNGSTTVASVAYTLDDVGNRTQRVDQQGTHTYAYDDLQLRRRRPPDDGDAAEPGERDQLHLGRQRQPGRSWERLVLVGKGFSRGPHGVGDGELSDDDLRLPGRRAEELADGGWQHHDVHVGHRLRPAGGPR